MSREAHEKAKQSFANEMAKTGHWSPRERIRRLTIEMKHYREQARYWRERALEAEARE